MTAGTNYINFIETLLTKIEVWVMIYLNVLFTIHIFRYFH